MKSVLAFWRIASVIQTFAENVVSATFSILSIGIKKRNGLSNDVEIAISNEGSRSVP
jgi:hypothetical protein